MPQFLLRAGVTIALCGGLLTVNPAIAEDRPADKILADIKAVEMPPIPQNRNDRAAVQEFLAKRQKAVDQKSELIGELYKAYPESPELPALIGERWQGAMTPGPKADLLNAEVESVLAKSKNEKMVAEAAFVKAVIGFRKAGQDADPSKLMALAEEFIKKAPKDARGALILSAVASKTTDTAKKEALTKRIESEYPDSPVVKQMAKQKENEIRMKAAEARLKDAIGKPIKLEFTEAIKGGQVSLAALKGKVVIIDFWATWCGPCVAEMPNMKKLYAEYKDKGVEFIGVSLDTPKSEGGYDALKAFVEKNKIEWPQYYDADGKAGEFATDWGINAIPTVFAVDADGNLATMEARGQLEKLIPELLKKAQKTATKP